MGNEGRPAAVPYITAGNGLQACVTSAGTQEHHRTLENNQNPFSEEPADIVVPNSLTLPGNNVQQVKGVTVEAAVTAPVAGGAFGNLRCGQVANQANNAECEIM